MRRHLVLTAILVLLVAILAFAQQTNIQSPTLPNRTYIGGADNTGRNRPVIGVNSTGDVQIDPDGIGIELGTVLASAPVTVRGTRVFFSGAPLFPGPIIDVIFCGDLPNAAINYTSPVTGYGGGAAYDNTANSFALAGSGCAAEDSATETTADEVMYANNAFRVLSLYCAVTSSGTEGVTLTLRDDAADLGLILTIPTGSTTGSLVASSLPTVAAGSAVALRAIATTNLSAQDVWCMARIILTP